MTKKVLKILGIILAVIILAAFLWIGYNYILIKRGDLVKWNNQWYTKQELQEMFGPQEYDVQAKNTPEEVYTKFRQALLDNDIETALEQIREENREEYREAFKDKEKFDKWVKMLPNNIIKENEYENLAYYDIDMGTTNKNTVSFVKNKNGYWKIDQI